MESSSYISSIENSPQNQTSTVSADQHSHELQPMGNGVSLENLSDSDLQVANKKNLTSSDTDISELVVVPKPRKNINKNINKHSGVARSKNFFSYFTP